MTPLNYTNMAKIVLEKGFTGDVIHNSKNAIRHALRAALIEAGEIITDFDECWEAYTKFFSNNSNLPERPALALTIAEGASLEEAEALYISTKTFTDKLKALYREDHANFKPQNSRR